MDNSIKDIRLYRVLIANFLLRAGKIIFQLFLNIFIWKETGDIQLLALFNLVFLLSHTSFFILFSMITKNGYKNVFHVASLLGYSGVLLSVSLLQDQVMDYVLYIAFFIGVFNGIYWPIYHSTCFNLTHYHNRGHYEGLKSAGEKLTKIFVPSLVGAIIGYNYLGIGYEIAFGIGAVFLFLSAFIGVVKTDIDKKKTSYNFWPVFSKSLKNKNIFTSLYTYSLTGFSFSNSLLEVIIPVILFAYVGNEAGLGLLVSLFAIASIIGSFIFGKFVSYKYYKIAFLSSGMIYVFSLLGFVTFVELQYMVIFSAILNFITVFFSIPQKVISDNVLHELDNYKSIRAEYMVVRELFLAVGWLLSFVCIYFVGSLEIGVVKYIFYIMVGAVIFSTISLSRINIHKE